MVIVQNKIYIVDIKDDYILDLILKVIAGLLL